jgi:hypothetical protein
MRWKTCRPLRRRAWPAGISVQEGDDPQATRRFHEIARLTGAPIAGSIQAQPGTWRALRAGRWVWAGGRQALLASGNAGALKLLEQLK